MLNQLFRITFITFVYKRYKQTILSSVLLLLVLWLIEKLHQDFISYSQLNEDTQYLALSFGLKWLAFMLVTGLYTVWNLVFKKENFKKEQLTKDELKKYGKLLEDEDKAQDDLLAKMQSIPTKSKGQNKKANKERASTMDKQAREGENKSAEDASSPDPFAQIREKETLNSKADYVLKNKK